jgi:hypothetical protein
MSMAGEQTNAGGMGPFLALLRRECRENRLFLLATVALLACSALLATAGGGHRSGLLAFLPAIACGLGLGVRAFAPDAANGTARFVAALPVSGEAVLAAKLAVRVLAIVLGTAVACGLAAEGAAWLPSAVGASTLFACLVGVLAGQVLDRPATAFAAGAALLVMLGRLRVQWILRLGHPDSQPVFEPTDLMGVAMGLAAATLLGVSYWLVSRR